MSTNPQSQLNDQVSHAISLIGDDHILCIIANLNGRGLRFTELQKALNDINPTTLTDRLKKLEQAGLVTKKKATLEKLSVVYELTPKGQGILPIVKAFEKFAQTFL